MINRENVDDYTHDHKNSHIYEIMKENIEHNDIVAGGYMDGNVEGTEEREDINTEEYDELINNKSDNEIDENISEEVKNDKYDAFRCCRNDRKIYNMIKKRFIEKIRFDNTNIVEKICELYSFLLKDAALLKFNWIKMDNGDSFCIQYDGENSIIRHIGNGYDYYENDEDYLLDNNILTNILSSELRKIKESKNMIRYRELIEKLRHIYNYFPKLINDIHVLNESIMRKCDELVMIAKKENGQKSLNESFVDMMMEHVEFWNFIFDYNNKNIRLCMYIKNMASRHNLQIDKFIDCLMTEYSNDMTLDSKIKLHIKMLEYDFYNTVLSKIDPEYNVKKIMQNINTGGQRFEYIANNRHKQILLSKLKLAEMINKYENDGSA